ncbi:MAG: glycosyltransferase family 2 protein, partial [Anaerolineae bacterium]
MTDPLDIRYTANPEYQTEHDGTYWLLASPTGWGIALDQWTFEVWSAFDGRPTDEVIASLVLAPGSTTALLHSTTKVLARMGLLCPSQPLPPPPTPSPAQTAPLGRTPLITIIVLAGRNARSHLETCLPSLMAQNYPNLELLLVDNQTTDDSVAFTRANYPQVRILSTGAPLGFDAANNRGIAAARGEFYLLLNDDTELEPDCIAECMTVMARSEQFAAVVPKMKLFYLRQFINSIGNSLYPSGLSCDNMVGYLDVGQFDNTHQVFSACFGAVLLRRSVIEEIGPLDEQYAFYFEDMDWSYRAQLRGYQIVAAPRAVVYHRFNATMQTLATTFKTGLIARNRLRFIWKNLNIGRAIRLTWIYARESLRHMLWARQHGQEKIAHTYRTSWGQWLVSWPRLLADRRRTRRSRYAGFR